MKNVHIIQTDKPSRLVYINGTSNKYHLLNYNDNKNYESFNISITSDEDIKDEDWLLIIDDFETYIHKHKGDNLPTTYHKKIILTTDINLIKDEVQAIDDEFLEWFVKNPSCKVVEVEKIPYDGTKSIDKYWGGEYKIIIPKDESKYTIKKEYVDDQDAYGYDVLVKKEPLEETLEEVAEKILANNVDGLKDALQDNDLFFFYKGVIQCYGESMAKWQQERSYSEEELLNLLTHFAVEIQRQNKKGQYPIEIKGWFERNKDKFKNK